MTPRDRVPTNPRKKPGDRKGWPIQPESLTDPDAVVIHTRPTRQPVPQRKAFWKFA